MIEKIVTRRLWAESLSEAQERRTVTVYVGDETRRPRVTAEINLSRLEGRGTAKAYIWAYEYQGAFDAEPWYQPVEPPMSANDPLRLVKGLSQHTFNDAISVTFAVTVTNMFVYANCSVFIYQTTSLRDLLLTPIRLLDRVVGP